MHMQLCPAAIMGISGLDSFVKKNFDWQRKQAKGTLVLDGENVSQPHPMVARRTVRSLCLGGRSPGSNTVVVGCVCVCLSVCLSLLFPRDG